MKIELTRAEVEAVLWAVGQFTESNANDIQEMKRCGMSAHSAKALIRADNKLREQGHYRRLIKTDERTR